MKIRENVFLRLYTAPILFLVLCSLSSNPVEHASLREPGLCNNETMLVITTSKYKGALADYLAWKRRRGLQVELDTTSVAKGADGIKNKIQQKYHREGLKYIILIGDINDVPSIMIDGAPSDPSYALIEGDDLIGEALISRISVNTVDELNNQLHKILVYEKGEFTRTDWIHHAVIASMDGFDGIAHSDAVEKGMKEHPEYFREVVKIMESDTNVTARMRSAIEDFGTNVIAHHGHGDRDRFGSLQFSASDARTLRNNGGGFPMIHGAACLTGSFHCTAGDCLAEAFMKAGTVKNPAGAIAFLGGSTSMDPYACIMAQKEVFVHQFYNKEVKTIGELFYRGTLYAIKHLSQDRADRLYRRWHLFGDCSTPIWKKAPIR